MSVEYHRGFKDGIRCFAWWKDGVQMVGTTGMTLATALEQLEELYGYNPPLTSTATNERPLCGACKKVMTPANSTAAPEMFLCDDCAKLHGYEPRKPLSFQ